MNLMQDAESIRYRLYKTKGAIHQPGDCLYVHRLSLQDLPETGDTGCLQKGTMNGLLKAHHERALLPVHALVPVKCCTIFYKLKMF